MNKGFSLIEIIIVIALLAVVASFSSLFSTDSISRSYALSERDLLVSLLTQIRVKALSNIDEQPHSLHVQADNYVMYEGTTYNASNPTNHIIPKISKAQIQGLDTITFEQLTANVPHGGTLHIINDMETYDIEVNEVGRINW
jgi:prepilin-type N-terminal cleavage/methylation domain-containing protein